MVDLTQAHEASIELLGTRHTALVDAVRNYVNGSVQPSIDELIAAIGDVTTDIDTKEKMLLGLASRQAKKPVPSLILDFKTRHYLQGTRRPEKGYGIHDLLTVERATPKRVYSASGKLVEVPAHEPAYQHDPVTGEPQGILIEESRTNLLTWSEDLTNADWSSTRVTITSTQQVTPGGAVSDVSFFAGVETTGSGCYAFKSITPPAGNYVQSCWAKAAGKKVLHLRGNNETGFLDHNAKFDLDTLSFIQAPEVSGGYEVCGDWIRVWQVVSYGGSSGNAAFFGVANDDGTPYNDSENGIYIWGAQLEEGSHPSSYTPTEDAQVTRAADRVFRTLGDEFNPSEGTLYLDRGKISSNNNFSIAIGSRSGAYLGLDYSRTRIAYFAPFTGSVKGSNGNQFEPHKFAASWQVLGPDSVRLIVARDGGIAANEVYSGDTSTISEWYKLSINDGFGDFIRSGEYRDTALFPRALTENELIDLTS